MAIERRTAVVTIYQGDILDRILHLEARAEAVKNAQDTPLMGGDKPEYLEIAEEHDKLVAEAEETALHVRVQALKRSSWKALIKEHPPREGNKSDAAVGVNEDDFKDVLVPFVNEDDPEDRTIVGGLNVEDLDDLSDIDFDRIYLTAFALTRGAGATPKANLVSRMTQPSDES